MGDNKMGERKLAKIARLWDVQPHDNADNLDIVKWDGWQCVTKKNEFHTGDYVVAFEIDSFIPTELAPFLTKAGKEPRIYKGVAGERLKTVRLRGQLSQGLILPLSVLGKEFYWKSFIPPNHWVKGDIRVKHEEGADCTDYLGILKWEPPVNAQLAGMSRGNFPPWICKTDESRIQNISKEIRAAFDRGDRFEVTMKLDGSSTTCWYNNGDVGVCSRNIDLKLDQEGNAFVDACIKHGLLDALKALGRNIAVQSELMGPGIQKNREKLDSHKLFPFKVWDIDNQRYLAPTERHEVLNALAELGFDFEHVPVLDPDFMLYSDSVAELLPLADGPSIHHKIREGVVLKRHDGEFSFKIISNNFLLKED